MLVMLETIVRRAYFAKFMQITRGTTVRSIYMSWFKGRSQTECSQALWINFTSPLHILIYAWII